LQAVKKLEGNKARTFVIHQGSQYAVPVLEQA
jgi:hypothetical protein